MMPVRGADGGVASVTVVVVDPASEAEATLGPGSEAFGVALSVADLKRLLGTGLIPVSKVPLTSKSRFATQNGWKRISRSLRPLPSD